MAFGVWGLLACSGVYWLVHLWAKPLPTPARAVLASEASGPRADLSRLFGTAAVTPAALAPAIESRFKLLGVVAPRSARGSEAGEGVALIAVDGVARTVRVGAAVDGELRLLAVNARSASLGQAGVVSLSLQLAAPTTASTGALAPAAPSPLVLGGQVPPAPPAAAPMTPVLPAVPEMDNRGGQPGS